MYIDRYTEGWKLGREEEDADKGDDGDEIVETEEGTVGERNAKR